jgi:hypothetical protein
MAVDYAKVREFARKKDAPIQVFLGNEPIRILPNGNLDLVDYIEKAQRFVMEGKSYTNAEFKQLIED